MLVGLPAARSLTSAMLLHLVARGALVRTDRGQHTEHHGLEPACRCALARDRPGD